MSEQPVTELVSLGELRNATSSADRWGALKRAIHLAGYTLEMAWGDLEWLLQEDRWKMAGLFDDVNKFLESVRLDKFRILADQRKRIGDEIKRLTDGQASNRAIARTLGVGRRTIDRDAGPNGPLSEEKAASNGRLLLSNGPNGPPAPKGTPDLTGEESRKLAVRQEKKLAKAEEFQQKRDASRNAEPLPNGMEVRIGDCRKVLADIPDNSVPLILTDPPYGDEAQPLYEWLAEFAAAKLVDGGSLVCYTGQSRLDRDMAIFSNRLRYWWLLVMPHDQPQRMIGKKVLAGFKPVLWYVKNRRRNDLLMPDVLGRSPKDKTEHKWGQGDAGVWSIIETFTEPGELIVDPFAGTALWGKCAISMGRRWLGADVEVGGSENIAAEAIA